MDVVRRAPLWAVIVLTALLASVLTLGLDRGLAALRVPPTPTAGVPAQPVIVLIETPEPEPLPSVLPSDEAARVLQEMQQQQSQQLGYTFVDKAIWQVSFAGEALAVNDGSRADRELVAAKASLDEAFRLVAEDLKPQIDQERLEIGRIRAELEINPRGLDEELRRMRDRLLSLISARPQ